MTFFRGHPKLGASWEGLVLEELLQIASERDIFFYSTYSGAEVDFVVRSGVDLIGFEAKRSDAPALTKSMRVVLDDLGLKHLLVVIRGRSVFRCTRRSPPSPSQPSPRD